MSVPDARPRRLLGVFLLAACGLPGLAQPQPQPAAATGVAAEIQRINENMTLLQARLNELELRARIAARQKELGVAPAEPVQSSFDTRQGNPSVLAVAGLRGQLEATLVFPGGVVQRVRAGDVIDDRRVGKVQLNEVVLTDLQGRNRQRLAFGSTPLTRERSLLAAPPTPPAPGLAGLPAPLPNLALPASLPAVAR
jgi:type IV pilus biogenesis protein PilP